MEVHKFQIEPLLLSLTWEYDGWLVIIVVKWKNVQWNLIIWWLGKVESPHLGLVGYNVTPVTYYITFIALADWCQSPSPHFYFAVIYFIRAVLEYYVRSVRGIQISYREALFSISYLENLGIMEVSSLHQGVGLLMLKSWHTGHGYPTANTLKHHHSRLITWAVQCTV